MRKILSFALAICMIASFFVGIIPQTAWAADEVIITDAAMLQDELNKLDDDTEGVFVLAEDLELDTPISIPAKKTVTIRGPQNPRLSIRPKDGTWPVETPLIMISSGAVVTLERITISGAFGYGEKAMKLARGIYVELGGATVTLNSVSIFNCHGGAKSGAALCVSGSFKESPGELNINNCVFMDNSCSTVSSTSGGAIYIGSNYKVAMKGTQFLGNKAHSGGALYCSYSYIFAEDCKFGFRSSADFSNIASQRGGAIHCHGTMILKDCLIIDSLSEQNGGGIYISSNEQYQGLVLLDNTKIRGNAAYTSGGGIYMTSGASLYIKGNSEVWDNNIVAVKEEAGVSNFPYDNNIFYTSMLNKIVLLDKPENKLGISTVNPYDRKVAVHSMGNVGGYSDLKGRVDSDHYTLDTKETFLLNPGDADGMVVSDSDIWEIRDLLSDPEAAEVNSSLYQQGKLWLKTHSRFELNEGTNNIIFDFNLPGRAAVVHRDLKAGTPVSLPTVSNATEGNVKFVFLGWYDDPANGTKITAPIQVTDGMGLKVYYAHWRIEVIPIPVPVPEVGKMYLVYFDQNYPGGGFTTAYNVAGQFSFNAEYSFENPETGVETTGSQTIKVDIPWSWPGEPWRAGYEFDGWSTLPTGGTIVDQTTWTPSTISTTLYAQWTPHSHTLTWNANGGTGGGTTTQDYDTTVVPPSNQPTRTGYTFTGWYLDKNCTVPLTSGTRVTGDATFYAGWQAKEYTITWDAGYTGGAVTAVTQRHGESLNILPAPTREGYDFGGWYKGNTRAEGYGTVKEDATFTARWVNEAQNYTVTVEWADHSDNDLVRPESITVSLLANGIPTGLSHTLQAGGAETSGDVWSYTFAGLDVTDAVSNPITYSVAITSPVSDQYSYGIENKSAELGYILLTHSLITRDVDAYVAWADKHDQDGVRPATIDLRLCANGTEVDGGEAVATISGSGDTWFYRFRDVQKYYTDEDGNKGLEILYSTRVNRPEGYEVEYSNYTAILSHDPATVSRSVQVEWQDNNDQDGKRPASMAVQLYGDNVPLEGKVALLSGANSWTHTWDELPKYADGGREVTYSARVASSLVDYTARSAGMTVEMAYVPSSTSISAFVTWSDEQNADGLRPDYITAELVADGKATGDSQVLSATNGWTMNWDNYPIYKDGKRIEYTFKVDAPESYEAAYHGVYDTSGLSAVLTHRRLTKALTGNIVWDDRDNQSGGRMSRVAVLLYADGSVVNEDDKVWISADDGWEHTFSDLPVYRGGGEEIKYSMALVSDPGKYVPTESKMTITMRLEPEYVDVPFQIIWDDNNNSDGTRPSYVAVALLVDGKPSQYGQTATDQTDWAADFTHLDRYGANGLYSYKAQLVAVPDGYTAAYTSPGVVVLKRVAETKSVTATVIWQDNDDQYSQRPEQVTLTLYADYLDGNGPQNTGTVVKCKAAEGWEYTFEDVPAYHGGKNIIYSVMASGNLPNYTIFYDGMEIYIRHASYQPEVYIDYTANVVWHDGHNAKGSRPYDILVTLYANGEVYKTQTLTEGNLTAGYAWSYIFKKLPAKMGGADVVYTIGITELDHYTTRIEGNTITLTHVMDIPILLRWADQRNNDGVRPSALTLALYGNAAQTDTTLTLTGGSTAEMWRDSFQQIPVWSESQLNHEIVYTWAFAGDSLAANGYNVDYNGYCAATVGNEALYPIDIARPGEVTDVAATILWNDNTDQDGLRPTSRTVRLYADGEDTGKAITLKGGNEDENWRGKFTALPVWKNGQRIQYSIQAEALGNYTAAPVPGDPLTLMMSHTPFVDGISATVIWRDNTNKGGLTRFPISVALKVDGTVTDNIQTIENPNTSVSFGEHPRYHDHGKPYEYAVQVTDTTMADKPADYEITADERTVTVWRERFHLSGKVLKHIGSGGVAGATVTLFEQDRETVVETVTADANGVFQFTVVRGNYYLKAEQISGSYYVYGTDIVIGNVDQEVYLKLIQTYTISGLVTDSSKGTRLSGAQVVARQNQRVVGTAIADNQGNYAIDRLPAGIYQLQAYYTKDNTVYLSETYTGGPMGYNVFVDLVIAIPDEGAPRSTASGQIVGKNGQDVSNILVRCRNSGATPNTLLVEATTDSTGHFKLLGLPKGTYTLTIINSEGQELLVDSPITFTAPDVETSIELGIISLSGGTVLPSTPTGAGSLSGVALDKNGQPVQGAQVIVTDKSTGKPSSVITTSPDGSFNTTLPAGDYTVEVWRPFENTTDLPIHANDEEADREDGLVTADSFTISGEVLDEDGEPKEGVTVYLYVEDDQAVEAVLLQLDEEVEPDAEAELDVLALGGYVRLDEVVTAEDGKYVFSDLPAGRYVVKIAEGIGGNGGSTDIPVTVAPTPEIPDDADLTITTDSYTVSGMVEDRNGQPVHGATVTLLDEHGEKVAYLTTNEDGVYEFANLPKGDYTVNISYPDSELLSSGDVSIPDGGFTVFPGCAVTGTIKDNKGNALSNVTVTFQDDANNLYTAVTDKDGTYRVALADGRYTMVASYQGKTAKKAVTVKGQAIKADLTITLSTGDNETPGGNTPPSGSGSSGIGGGGFDPGPVEEQPTSFVRAYINGYSDGTFGGGKHISRSEVAALISRVSADFDKDKTYSFEFRDVAANAWYANNLGYCVQAGLIQGRGNGLFDPTASITRSEFAAIVARFLGLPNEGTGENPYTDTAGNWAEGYIAQLTAKGIVEGKGNGKFDPNANITRYEAVTMLNRVLERIPDKAVLDTLASNLIIRVFPDLEATHWAYYQVLEAANEHYHK